MGLGNAVFEPSGYDNQGVITVILAGRKGRKPSFSSGVRELDVEDAARPGYRTGMQVILTHNNSF
jgi:hypothetical protein